MNSDVVFDVEFKNSLRKFVAHRIRELLHVDDSSMLRTGIIQLFEYAGIRFRRASAYDLGVNVIRYLCDI